MIDTVLNLLFRCPHRQITRPITPVMKSGEPHGQTYVVCLDCGKQFSYDTTTLQIGKPIDRSHETGVLSPDVPKPNKKKLGYALLAAVPAAILVGVALKGKKPATAEKPPKGGKPDPGSGI